MSGSEATQKAERQKEKVGEPFHFGGQRIESSFGARELQRELVLAIALPYTCS